MSLTTIEAVIFDMDGVIIDTEPAWQKAEVEVLNQLGVPITMKDAEVTTGLRIDLLVAYWYQRYPWDNYDNRAVAQQIIDKVVTFIETEGAPMRGVIDALKLCQQKQLKIGLATSSSTDLIDSVMAKLGIRSYFEAIASAENLQYGKPHPEVYLNCANALKVNPAHCLAIEDSFNGLIAARAATMQTVAIPAPEFAEQSRWVIAHQQLEHLGQLADVLDTTTRI
ncbi:MULTISPECIES: hexitol phosphatase HxpB [Shewanella]|uniref:hexitol phosphatase HxpB n=1 Tax=Shewanella TaxID=22 RepID=UPI0006D6697B|nr:MULTISPECIES: hexitol phosphatase HxpB [Shewanella]KPZ73296.1 2-deoxyglucose-6-phosphate phosphatase [Shewanella sp. P1-14-1]